MFRKRFSILVVIAVFLGGVVMGLGLNPNIKPAPKDSVTIQVQGRVSPSDGLEIKPSQTSAKYPWDQN